MTIKNLDVNWVPRSEMMPSGRPWRRKIVFINTEAVSVTEGTFEREEKWAILKNRSTTTKMQVKPLDLGRSFIKSIDIEDQGWDGISNDWRNP